MQKNRFAIILCGGSGKRLWPLSRENNPKQFLFIDNKLSLFQQTILRAAEVVLEKNIYVVTNEEHKYIAIDQIKNLHLKDNVNFIFEPQAKNTLAAISFATKHIFSKNPDSSIIVLSSDHLINNTQKFISTIKDAFTEAENDQFLLIGIQPDKPSISYGYINLEKNTNKKSMSVLGFREKPDLKDAKKYFKEGYLWNAGIFLFKSNLFFQELSIHQSYLYKLLYEEYLSIDQFYDQCESVSVDYGLIEKIKHLKVIKATFSWSDLGTWDSISSSRKADRFGNVFSDNVVQQSTKNTYVYSNKQTVALCGIENLVVVSTSDAVLILNKNNSENIKELVNLVEENSPNLIKEQSKVHRPWGSYTVMEQGKGYKIKRIEVNPKQKLSLQLHKKRSEHWVVIEGVAKVTNGNKIFNIKKDQSTYIPINTIHRLENPADSLLKIIEVQSGNYLEEDDIERFDDKYGR